MNNIVPQDYAIDAEKRMKLKNHKPLVVWFTGLSGSGKSTLANLVEQQLHEEKIHTYSLDGDNIRGGLNKDLGFSEEERSENIRRIAEVSKLFFDSGTVVIAAFITPLNKDRNIIKDIVGKANMVEIFVDASLEECEKRDVKGLYKKAREGKIPNFTGISAPFEAPKDPDLSVNTENLNVQEAASKILECIKPKLRLK